MLKYCKRANSLTKRLYTKHDWIKLDGNIAILGITDYAQKLMGSIITVDLPQKDIYSIEEELCFIEGEEHSKELYSIISGSIIEINKTLSINPSLINKSPESEGWICKMQLDENQEQIDYLLTKEEYTEFISN